VRAAHLVQRFPEMLQPMQAVGDLGGRGSPWPCAVGIGGRPIACHHLAPRRCPEPLRDGLGRPIREQRSRLPTLQVHQARAVGLALAEGEIVHAKDGGCGARRGGLPTQQAQEGVAAHPQSPLGAEGHPGRTTQRHAKGHEARGQPQRASRPGGGHGGPAFGDDAATAVAITAKPRADVPLETHLGLRPGQVGQGTCRMAVDALRWCGTERTRGRGLGRAYPQGDLCRGSVDMTRVKPQRGGLR
jgi:hypothetical protein